MDIGRMSMSMANNSLQNAVQLSVMKLQMNTNSEMATGMNEMIESMAVNENLGNVIDSRA